MDILCKNIHVANVFKKIEKPGYIKIRKKSVSELKYYPKNVSYYMIALLRYFLRRKKKSLLV